MTLDEIPTADRSTLLKEWYNLLGTPAPKALSQTMLRRFLAFELQAKRHGGLCKSVRTQLQRSSDCQVKPSAPRLKPGGRLIREWNGKTHVVEVMDDGFMWRGRRWRSLSVIAREITGAHWSGPRFFGLARARA